jgi:hypothetical protein
MRLRLLLAVLAAGLVAAAAAPAASAWTLTLDLAGNTSGTVVGAGFDCDWDGFTETGDCDETYAGPTAVTLPAYPEGLGVAVTWKGCSSVDGNECIIASRNADLTVTATFTRGFALTVTLAGTGEGSVSSAPPGVSCGSVCVAVFAPGTGVRLTAVAAAGSVFVRWEGACAGSAPCDVTMSQARFVTAVFDLVPATYTLNVHRDGKGRVSGGGIACGPVCSVTLSSGTTVELVADPAERYELVRWEGCDSVSGETCTVTITGPRTVEAVFRDIAVDAEVLGAAAGRSNGRRVVVAEIRTDEIVTVEIRLLRGNRVLQVRIVRSFRPGNRTVRLLVRATIPEGLARVEVELRDRAGNSETFRQPVRLPAAA